MADGNIKVTVDNLPKSLPGEYEKRRAEGGEYSLSDAARVRAIVDRDTLAPSTSATDSAVLGEIGSRSWGGTRAPNITNQQTRRAFEGGVGPSFAPQDRLDATGVRVDGIQTNAISKLKSLINEAPESLQSKIKDVENEANALFSLLETAGEIAKTIEYVRTEMTRFQKG